VHPPFRLRQPAIDVRRHGLNDVGKIRCAKNLQDIAKLAMRDAFVMMSVVMVRVVVVIFVIVAGMASVPAVFARYVHVEVECSQPTLVNAMSVHVETVHRQLTQLSLKCIGRQTGVNERAQNHIAARA
jgi:hypothetical protein